MNPLRKVIDNYFKKPNETTHNVMRTIFAYNVQNDKLLFHLQSQKINIINSLVSSDLLIKEQVRFFA